MTVTIAAGQQRGMAALVQRPLGGHPWVGWRKICRGLMRLRLLSHMRLSSPLGRYQSVPAEYF